MNRNAMHCAWMMMWALGAAAGLLGCGGTDADALGIASTCAADPDCPEVTIDGEAVQLTCVTDFRGGYCTIRGCADAADCPADSACVAHTDGKNYCFRECVDKSECNANRPAEDEANCSSNFDYATASDNTDLKACVPPSSD